jgi:antitoxin (DNA-binding transcriptional repressor) of toxin-antitoxin stability system
MKKMTISVTDAARNFADCINRVRYQNASFTLLKGGVPVARLIPDTAKKCFGQDLATALLGVELTNEEASTWRRELNASRSKIKAPADKWG